MIVAAEMQAAWQHRSARIHGIRLHYVEAGSGSPVILLHGFPEFWYGWRKQIGPLTEAGYQLLIPDQRGYNDSDKPTGVSAYRIEELAQDILGLIEASGHEKARLVGHDWGGIIAWHLALTHPERVESLAVMNSPHPQSFLRSFLLDPTQSARSAYAIFFQIDWLPEAICRNNDWELVVQTMINTSLPGSFTEEDFDRYRQAWWRRGAFTAMLNWYRASFRTPPMLAGDQQIHVPVLLIWGAKDFALSRGMAVDSIDLCDNGRLVMLDYATHWVQHDEAPRVNELLLEFLSG